LVSAGVDGSTDAWPSKIEFSDNLNDALMQKGMDSFWKLWRSTFGSKHSPLVMDGMYDEKTTADRFVKVFESVAEPNFIYIYLTTKGQLASDMLQ